MSERLLEGVVVGLLARDSAARVCARHLTRMGATVREDAEGAAVLLVDGAAIGESEEAGDDGLVVCVFEEQHVLVGGGLVASEATAQAALGMTGSIGEPGGRPARTGCDVATSVAAFCATQGILASLAASVSTRFSVSAFRALSALRTILWAARSRPDDWVGTHVRSREREVDCGYRAADGWVTLDFPVGAEAPWRSFVGELGLDGETIDRLAPRWYQSVGWGDDVDEARPVYEERIGRLSTDAAVGLIRRNGGSSVPFLTPDECLAQPQSEALGLGESRVRGLPWWTEAGRSGSRPARPLAGDPSQPLTGVRVVDFGVGGVGPFAATLLGWLGADVVKVEAPNEFILTVEPTVDGVSTTYLALNQGKRSVSLDLKDAGDAELARRLVAGADVLVENFRPGALGRLGLGFEDVARINPTIVYCSASGFGPIGPLAAEPCTDPHMQAFSGFAWLNAERPGAPPRRLRYYGFVDLVTSCVIAEAACAGLLASRQGSGALHLTTSMLQAVVEVLPTAIDGERPAPDEIVRTQDGYVALTCRDDTEWQRLLDILGRPAELGGPGLARGRERLARSLELRDELDGLFSARPGAAWAHALGRAGIPCVRVVADEDVIARRDAWERGIVRDLPLRQGEPLVAGGPPWRFERVAAAPTAPLPGRDTEVLRADPASFWQG